MADGVFTQQGGCTLVLHSTSIAVKASVFDNLARRFAWRILLSRWGIDAALVAYGAGYADGKRECDACRQEGLA